MNKNKKKMKDIRHMQGVTWIPKSIPAGRVMENGKRKAASRQKLKAECRRAMEEI